MRLHNDIMNIQVGTIIYDLFDHKAHAYKCGHRDARHAAAEMSLKYEALIERLFDALCNNDLVDQIKEEYGL